MYGEGAEVLCQISVQEEGIYVSEIPGLEHLCPYVDEGEELEWLVSDSWWPEDGKSYVIGLDGE